MVEVHGFAQRQVFKRGIEQAGLNGRRITLGLLRLSSLCAPQQECSPGQLAHGRAGNRVHVKAGALGLARPIEIGRLLALKFLQGCGHCIFVT